MAATIGVVLDVVDGRMRREYISTVMNPWMFAYLTSWIHVLREKEGVMNTFWRIAILEVALFTVAVFLEAAEFGIERHERYDYAVSAKRAEGRDILLEIPVPVRAFFSLERFCCLFHTCGANVECVINAYLQSFEVDWFQVGGSGKLG